MLDKLQNFIDIIMSMIKFLANPTKDYYASDVLTLNSSYLELTNFRCKVNLVDGVITLIAQYRTTKALSADVSYQAGIFKSNKFSPLYIIPATVTCNVADVGAVKGTIFSTNSETPDRINIKPTTSIPNNSYIYLTASYIMGGVLTKLHFLIKRRCNYFDKQIKRLYKNNQFYVEICN